MVMPLQAPGSQAHAADPLNNLARSSLVLCLHKPMCYMQFINVVIRVVRQRIWCLWAPVRHAPTDVARDGDGVKHVAVLQHIQYHAHVGELTRDGVEGLIITLVVAN